MIKDFYDGMTLDEIYTKRIKYNSPVLERLSTIESLLKNIKVQFTGNYNDLTNKPDLSVYAIDSEVQEQLDSIGVSISDIEREISEEINVELSRLETDKVDYTDGNIDLATGKTYKINNVDVISDKAKVDGSNLTAGNIDSFNAKLGSSTKIVDITTTTDATSISIDELDLIADGGVYDIVFNGKATTAADLFMRVNDISTNNYNYTILQFYNNLGTVTGGGSQSQTFFSIGSIWDVLTGINLTLTQKDENNLIMYFNEYGMDASYTYGRVGGGIRPTTATITKITIYTASSNIKAGSNIKIYKRSTNSPTRS
jgi:hypothetical protein